MLEFTFEIIDEAKINIQYKYGSQFFNFNLFCSNGEWKLHPFDGILIENREMCRLVVSDLLQNKDFHVMLAKEKSYYRVCEPRLIYNQMIRKSSRGISGGMIDHHRTMS